MTGVKRTRRTGAGARINADHIGLYWLIVAGILATATAAIITSWNGLIYVAGWQQLPTEFRFVTPVMIDVAIIVFTLGKLAKVSRGEGHVLFTLGAYSLTAVSAAANFLHTIDLGGLASFEAWTGALLNALAPLLILLTTEVLGSLITRPKRIPKKRKNARRSTARKPAEVTTIHAVEDKEVSA